mmetsp:Transcript_15999/g.21544  ORF Transcript_15999/g.21544 Transcript_15999/m.21544 type:complete len:265 (-) Transcript_15999:143-937(-)
MLRNMASHAQLGEGHRLRRNWNLSEDMRPLAHGRNPWPTNPEALEPVLEEYTAAMLDAGGAVMKALGLALGTSENLPGGPQSHLGLFKQFFDDSFWVMRCIHYPGLAQAYHGAEKDNDDDCEAVIGCGEHTDYGCLTLVMQKDQPDSCLQVKKVGTDEWIDAPPVRNTLVCNLGDMLQIWTAGRYRSTPHRVLTPSSGASRISVPFFLEPNFDAHIVPLFGGVSNRDRASCRIGRAEMLAAEPYSGICYGQHLYRKVSSNFDFA